MEDLLQRLTGTQWAGVALIVYFVWPQLAAAWKNAGDPATPPEDGTVAPIRTVDNIPAATENEFDALARSMAGKYKQLLAVNIALRKELNRVDMELDRLAGSRVQPQPANTVVTMTPEGPQL